MEQGSFSSGDDKGHLRLMQEMFVVYKYWLPALDKFRNWLCSGEAKMFFGFANTLGLTLL